MAHLWLPDQEGGIWGVLPLEGRELDLAGLRWQSADSVSEGSHRREIRSRGRPGGKDRPRTRATGRRKGAGTKEAGAGVLLMRAADGHRGTDSWVLLAGPDSQVRVNGRLLLWGAHALQDQDEIRVGSETTAFFSTERLARIEPMEEGPREIYCPRCSLQIAVGTPSVRCPRCGIWHHASEEYPCWGYAPTCTLCPQPTPLGAGFRWTPAHL